MGEKIQDNILFLGNRDDVNRIYQAMDVFVLPSRYEGLPVVAVEAQASGLPCVLSDCVTFEAKITDLVRFVDLGVAGSAGCALVVLDAKREVSELQGDFHSFDIDVQAKKLQEYYLDVAHVGSRRYISEE